LSPAGPRGMVLEPIGAGSLESQSRTEIRPVPGMAGGRGRRRPQLPSPATGERRSATLAGVARSLPDSVPHPPSIPPSDQYRHRSFQRFATQIETRASRSPGRSSVHERHGRPPEAAASWPWRTRTDDRNDEGGIRKIRYGTAPARSPSAQRGLLYTARISAPVQDVSNDRLESRSRTHVS
jgi:hypothetical protein